MVRGLDTFREYFRQHTDSYLLIGGTACDVLFREAGLEFRATKDLDIVLCVEALDTLFVRTLWDFIKAGEYGQKQQERAGRQYYRFRQPASAAFPSMLELFSRQPDALSPTGGSHLTPIPVEGDMSSLSAILLDADYYRFLINGRRLVDGIAVVGPERLIPLKARAWLDMSERRSKGESMASRDIRKHRNDVFRLYNILDPRPLHSVPRQIQADLDVFLTKQAAGETNLKALGLGGTTFKEIVDGIRRVFGL
jgi:hypothetical protein